MRAEDVEEAARTVTGLLREHTGRDWSVPAGPLEWSCRETAVHVADDMFGYAAQVAVGAAEGYAPFGIAVAPDTPPDGILDVVGAGAALLASAIRAAGPEVRGWHPMGVSDPGGFAAMGVVELLVHADDIAGGLGVDPDLPAGPAREVLARLWPDVDPGTDPAATLRHVTGRAPRDGVAPPRQWRWHSAVR